MQISIEWFHLFYLSVMFKKLSVALSAFLVVLVTILSSCFISCDSDNDTELLISIVDSLGERVEGKVYVLRDGTYSAYANGVFSGNLKLYKVESTEYLRYSCEPGNYLIIATSILPGEIKGHRGHSNVTALKRRNCYCCDCSRITKRMNLLNGSRGQALDPLTFKTSVDREQGVFIR